MQSLYERIMGKAEECEQAARYLRAMAQGSVQACDDLEAMCEHRSYQGAVFAVRVDAEIGDVRADADEEAAPAHDGDSGPSAD